MSKLNEKEIKKMSAEEFIRRLKDLIENCEESKFVFFIGAGCSVSSRIPDAGTLVKQWLPRLKKLKTGDENHWEPWVHEIYPDYNEKNAASFYGRVIEDLFLHPEERQREIERLTEGKDPGFGYAVLAQLMTYEKCGRNYNIVVTVNFDDLIADALYLYTNKKPLVISHDSLVGFVRITRTRPLILKLHGDARLEPKNTELETKELADSVKKVLKTLFSETGIIFVGYGGHDKSIVEILENLPMSALPWGVYWVGSNIPKGKTGEWLKKINAVHVNHKDFDELMLLMWNEFDLGHPDEKRFRKLLDTYFNTFKKLKKRIEVKPYEESKRVKEALEKATREFKNWWTVELEAEKYKKTDPKRVDEIYQEGIKKFPDSTELLNNYASFLGDIRKKYDEAEEYYKKALEIDPENADILGNYAIFLKDIRKKYDEAEEYYKKALEIDPENANNLDKYASFLEDIRKKYDEAEKYYKKALEIDPENANNLDNYAIFLKNIRKKYDEAEEYYKKALEIDPEHANNWGNYAGFLLSRGRNKGFELLEKALKLLKGDISLDSLKLECLFYQYAHSRDKKKREKSLKELKKMLNEGIRSPHWDLSQNVERVKKDGHPHPEFLSALAQVISNETNIEELEKFDVWNEK